MKPQRVAILFDSHTPYLAFRVNALQRELGKLGLRGHIELHVILIGADWAEYGWAPQGLQGLYDVPVHVLSKEFHGLGLRSFFHRTVPGNLLKLAALYYKLRPRITLTGGYDRPENIWCRILSYPLFAKVGVMHDPRFNDAESFSKSIFLEFIKSLVVARYSFFMCSGRECADYSRFLGGAIKPVYTEAWDVVDNEAIGRSADDPSHDAEILQRFGLSEGTPFFFCPARFVPKKNLPFLLHAYSRYVRDLGPGSTPQHLVLCGQGPEKDRIEQIIREESLTGLVTLCKWLPYEFMPRACRLSTALILASTHDQWGMTVNEALSAGTPALVSNRCGAHELIKNNVNGFTFSPNDGHHLTTLLRQLHDDTALVARLKAACATSMQSFSIRQFLDRYLALFSHYGLLPEAKPLSNTNPA